MLNNLDPASALAVALLIFCFVMVILFEATNGFHDAANAVATVIYTKSLAPVQAVVLSGLLNFAGVLLGGIAVAYALVELIPAEVLSPPDGGPAVGMLVALFSAALFWNIGTWWLALPNSSSHCLIGSLIGVAVGNAFARSRSLAEGVHWPQLWKVLEALALSPVLGFVFAGLLYLLCRKTLHDENLYKPAGDKPPIWWMRGILILTCSGVSFAHGTNDGQKSIGLIMLTIIGLFPATYALNPEASRSLDRLPAILRQAEPLVTRYGDDEKQTALDAAHSIEQRMDVPPGAAAAEPPAAPAEPPAAPAEPPAAPAEPPASPAAGAAPPAASAASPAQPSSPGAKGAQTKQQKSNVRDDVYRVISQLKHAEDSKSISAPEKKEAQRLSKELGSYVEYAPLWVRMLSALCLGVGTMIGYKRIVKTLGERLGNVHLTPAQGASAEVVSAVLIGTAGFTGLPVSTTHIVTSGIGGTMVAAGAGLRYAMIRRIVLAWVLTLPVTILVAGGLYYLLASPKF
jgi:PiT family inorganic phosphate transporter